MYRYEMAVTAADFLRLLPDAVGSYERRRDRSFAGRTERLRWRVRCVELPQRRIGALALPVLDVTLIVAACDTRAEKEFVERFLRAYQRAGG